MGRVFTAVRALVYGSGFVFLWGWLALTAARLDRAAGRELPDVSLVQLVGLAFMAAVVGLVPALTACGSSSSSRRLAW